jgi:hypothetical protein
MKSFKPSHLLALLAMTLMSVAAQAQPILQQRCNTDSLDPTAAAKRLDWARKCGLIQNIGNTPAFDTWNYAYDGTTHLYDYAEADSSINTDGRNTYSGVSFDYNVNYTYVTSLYELAGTHQDQQVLNNISYYRWWRDASKQKARPLYPTFGSTADITSPSNAQLYVNVNANPIDCRVFSNSTFTTPVSTFYVNGYCESSCYTPEQQVLFSDGYHSIVDAVGARREDLITLTPSSTLDEVKLQQNKTYSYTAEFRDSEHPIVEVRTQSGGLLRVTVEHPVLQGEGRMVQAQRLKVGDELVKTDGSLDAIVSVTKAKHFGKVYNLKPVTQDLVSNILVAQGFLVGSSTYQNDDVGYINRIILHRGAVSASALPR